MDTRQLTHEVRLQHWAEVLRRRRESGQTIRGFCRTEGICEKTYYWQKRIRQAAGESLLEANGNQAGGSLAPAPVFAALPVPKSTGTVRVEIGGAEWTDSRGGEIRHPKAGRLDTPDGKIGHPEIAL